LPSELEHAQESESDEDRESSDDKSVKRGSEEEEWDVVDFLDNEEADPELRVKEEIRGWPEL
jgi:hypothetical protein